MSNAQVIELSQYQASRDKISERNKLEKYLKMLPLHDLMYESNQLTQRLHQETLNENLIMKCQAVIQEINNRMDQETNEQSLNKAFQTLLNRNYPN